MSTREDIRRTLLDKANSLPLTPGVYTIILETKRGISSGYSKADIQSIELIKDAED